MQEIELECVLVQYRTLVSNGLRNDFLTRRLVQAFTSVYPPFLRHALHINLTTLKVTYHPHQLSETNLITSWLKFKFADAHRPTYENVQVKMELKLR